MPVTNLLPSSIVAATGWTNATTTALATNDTSRATGGTAGEFIEVELDNSPALATSANSIEFNVVARTQGSVSRAKSLLVELYDASSLLLTSTTFALSGTDTLYTFTAARSDDKTGMDGYKMRATVQEGGGMADSATVEINQMFVELDYSEAPLATRAYIGQLWPRPIKTRKLAGQLWPR